MAADYTATDDRADSGGEFAVDVADGPGIERWQRLIESCTLSEACDTLHQLRAVDGVYAARLLVWERDKWVPVRPC